ncbi:MAG: energy-coupling factor ABC transporter ATP-binding protein [Sphaerochaetaceae bacterium]
MHPNPALEVSDLGFAFSTGKHILRNISFTLGTGEFAVLTGRNGAGKSVLLKCLKGLYQPDSGTISINGVDLSTSPGKRNKAIALVFQDTDSQVVGQTVERDILFGLENLGITGAERDRRFQEVVGLLGLTQQINQRPRTLSGGERRRLAIAGVLVMAPQVLILDEPFANLDYTGVCQVLETLVDLKKKGVSILVVTHEIEKVLAYADRLILLDTGRIIANDTVVKVLPLLEDFGVRRPMYHGKPVPVEDLTWLK